MLLNLTNKGLGSTSSVKFLPPINCKSNPLLVSVDNIFDKTSPFVSQLHETKSEKLD